jgi:hypothetical protein
MPVRFDWPAGRGYALANGPIVTVEFYEVDEVGQSRVVLVLNRWLRSVQIK